MRGIAITFTIELDTGRDTAALVVVNLPDSKPILIASTNGP